jgi:hypothetical protein
MAAVFHPLLIARSPVSAINTPGWVPLPLSVYSPSRTDDGAPAT